MYHSLVYHFITWKPLLVSIISNALLTIKKEAIIKIFECCGIAAKGKRVDGEKLNSKLKSILMGVSVEDSDIEANGSDDEDESDEALEIVDGDDTEYDSHDDEIGMMINNDDEN